jgi:hypothetical protein
MAAHRFFAVVAVIAGCSGTADDHPIDKLVVPRLAVLGISVERAPAEEYCRRLTIDLWGRIPTGVELDACVALPDAAARVDAAMASPLYERTMRRAWGESLGYNNFYGWTEEVVDLDAYVGSLYRDEVGYGTFASTVVVHGGFLGLHRYDEWAAALWRVFLGRPARADEIAAFRPLSYVWQPRYFCEGHIYDAMYRDALDEGLAPAAAKAQAQEVCLDLERTEWAVNFCACSSDENGLGCRSSVLGAPIELTGSCSDSDDVYADANVRRIDEQRQAGEDRSCADGVERPECVDIQTDFTSAATMKLPPLPIVDGAGRKQLGKIGDALVARGDFWESAIDREAKLLLGWWQSTFRHPDSDLPDVRRALADRLRDKQSVRDIQKLILTSVLYTVPAEPQREALPDYAMAPTKLMTAENWLDSAATAVGEPSGVCDFRWVTPEGFYDSSIVQSKYAEPSQLSIYDARQGRGAYLELAIKLGGCNAEARRPTLSNVGMAYTEGMLSQLVCAYGRGIVPEGFSGDLEQGARHVIRELLGRTPPADEITELAGEMQACIAAGGAVGCADVETAVRWLCQRALESTEFSTY